MKKTFKIPAKSEYLAGLRAELQDLMNKSGLKEKIVNEMSLAIDEALTNVIRHGYDHQDGLIEIEYGDYSDRVEIAIRDQGKLFDPLSLPTPKLPPTKPGGLGVHFIRTLVDEVTYAVRESKTNELRLIKNK
jgi:serine/threonine-protein kinase RsbW